MAKTLNSIASLVGLKKLVVTLSSTNILSLAGVSRRDRILVDKELAFYLMSRRDIIIFSSDNTVYKLKIR